MKIRALIITLCIQLVLCTDVKAAFPVSIQTTSVADTPVLPRGEVLIFADTTARHNASKNNALGADGQPIYKKRSRARFLALIGAIPFLFLPMGLHRIYLGYYRQGLIRLTSPYLLMILTAAAMALNPAVGILIGLIFVDVYIALIIWQIKDMAHISNGKLQPKNGTYKDKKIYNDTTK